MELGDLPQSMHPDYEVQEELPKRSQNRVLGILWLIGMLCLAGTFGTVARYFDAGERLNTLVTQKRAVPLREWTLRAYNCPSYYSDFNRCKTLGLESAPGKTERKLKVSLPLSTDLKTKLNQMSERPTHLHLSYILSEHEKLWLSQRTSDALGGEASLQALRVQLGSFECVSKTPGGEDFDLRVATDKLACFTQTSTSEVKQMPEDGRLDYYITIGPTGEMGPSRWPFLLVENQYLHEVMSLDNLTHSSVVLWNLIALLMPIFVIAFRFVFKNETILNTLADYSVAMFLYALCVIGLQQAHLIPGATLSLLSIVCVLLEGVVLTLLLRYAYSVSSGTAWSIQASILVSTFAAIIFLASFAISKQSPQAFLVKSHYFRDAIAATLGLALMGIGFLKRQSRFEGNTSTQYSSFTQAHDDFGTQSYFVRIGFAALPLLIFGMSNFRELVNPTMKTLKWEDLLFLPSQTALIAFFLGVRTTSTMKYGKSMKARLESLFSGILSLQRTVTPIESVDAIVKGIRETLPSTTNANVEYIESNHWDTNQIQSHITLAHNTLYIPLHGTTSYKGLLRFEGVEQENLSEEEDYILSTMASALAVNLEKQESASDLEKMHQASLRFVPHDFLRLLKSKSLIDFNLGDHIELRMAVMFTDIRNFTQISEGMTPSQNFEFINSFLTQIAPVIKHHGGFIDKYIGDAIMALFPESPVHAVRCAIDIQIALRTFNDRWLGLINQEVAVGTGIHYGPMVLGIVGYAERLSSTVMSDSVNLASRLESLTKKYAAKIIVSEDTLQHMSSAESKEFSVNMLDSVRVKGRSAMVTLYEVKVPGENKNDLQRAS
ncbi:MAG: adenylate/guanylate cyclase domain-containing protein [Betaproteobacteria bacterium]|nr:adenylate/guanylate cyclase domain-containing protein [Betaproteobacteria bacterium]